MGGRQPIVAGGIVGPMSPNDSAIAPSGQANSTDVTFLRAQVERAQSMQTVYLVMLAIFFVIALVQTFRLRRALNQNPWSGYGW